MFDSPKRLILGLLFGVVFGIALQKGGLSRFRSQLGRRRCTT